MAVRTRRKRTFTVAQYQPLICQASRGAGGDKRLSLTAGLPTHHSVPLRHKEEDISPPPACIASPLYLNTLAILVVSNSRPYHQTKPSLWKTLSRNPSLGRSSSPPQRAQTSVASLTGPGSDSSFASSYEEKVRGERQGRYQDYDGYRRADPFKYLYKAEGRSGPARAVDALELRRKLGLVKENKDAYIST